MDKREDTDLNTRGGREDKETQVEYKAKQAITGGRPGAEGRGEKARQTREAKTTRSSHSNPTTRTQEH